MEQTDYRLAAIMYTDIVGFSRMMERDEAGTLDILRFHNTLVTDIVTKRHGTVIKTIGDAFLVDFRNTVEALQCAMEIQAAVYAHNAEGKSQPLLMRIGLHLGDIYFFQDDALGEGINIASRLQSFARPGCICFSQDVYNQVLNKIDFRAEKLGRISLKNITKEIHAYEISSANIEFDPDKDIPRPPAKPFADAEKAAPGPAAQPVASADPAPSAAPTAARPLPSGTASPAERGYGPDDARAVLDDIRKAILADTKAMGRRLTVDEAIDRYGEYGVEAQEVISSMADKGLIQKRGASYDSAPSGQRDGQQGGQQNGSGDIASDIGRAVEGIARVIEQSVGDWQKSGQNYGRNRGDGRRGERVERNIERAMAKIERVAYKVGSKVDETQAIKDEYKRHERDVGTGKWDAEMRSSEYFKPGREELETDFSVYRDKIEERAHKSSAGFVGTILSFVGVNALLWYININVAPGFMWAAIVSAAWGTGVLSSLFAMVRGKLKAAEVDRVPEMEPAALDIYKKINRVKDGMAMHAASVISVPILLTTINVLTTPTIPWSAIPSGVMALSFIGHLISYPGTLRNLEKKLWRLLGIGSWRELFAFGKNRKAGAASGQYASVYAEVAAIRDDIVRDLKAGKGSDEFGKDMIPSLDRYVEQVKLLSQSVNEIDGIVASIPVDALKRDREALEAKRLGAGNQALNDEYGRSIAEISKQEKACKDLEDQRELLRLRLGSSANALKQLKIDMARMKALPEAGERQAMSEIRRKASELTGYLDDLKAGYDESSADPYAELERLAAEADARARLEGGKPSPDGAADKGQNNKSTGDAKGGAKGDASGNAGR